jgi:hypothetical protein
VSPEMNRKPFFSDERSSAKSYLLALERHKKARIARAGFAHSDRRYIPALAHHSCATFARASSMPITTAAGLPTLFSSTYIA